MKALTRAAGCFLAAAAILTYAPTHAADDASRTLRLGYVLPENHAEGLGARKLADLVAQKSGGRIKVQTFGNGVLGDELKTVATVQGGVLDLLIVTASPLVGSVKELGVLDALFLFQTPEETDAVLQGPVGDKLLGKLSDKGMIGLAWMEAGFRSMTNSKRPIIRAEDIQGLKFRTMQSKIFIDSFGALGANPVPMPFTEVFSAMETRAVDGAETAPGGVETNQWYEVQKYLALTRHAFAALIVVASKKAWDTLPDEDKRILREAAIEAARYERETNRQQENQAVEDLKRKGMIVTELSPEEFTKLRVKVQPVTDYIAKNVGEDLMKEVQAEIAKVRK
jgi:TRAP-type transport system periplasmic protein